MSDKNRVLIVGAGPVGFTVALNLAQRGIPVTILEGSDRIFDDPRAGTIHPPTLEMFDTLGVTPIMLEQGSGRIINISSVNGLKGQLGQTNYCAAKAGIIGFSKALAQENANKGITVNVIAPGTVDTPMVTANEAQFRLFRPDLPNPTVEDVGEGFKQRNPMGRP